MTFPRLTDAQRAWIRYIEWMVAALVAALIVVLHVLNLTHAGGLWRDESKVSNSGKGVVVAATLLPGVRQSVCVRMTNLDFVAQRLNREAGKEDLVLVHPWFCGVTFNRYYTGGAEWLTLPPLTDHRLQRLDLFKEQMQLEAPIQTVLEKVEATLRAGHIVWLVGYYPFSNPPAPPRSYPPLGRVPRAGERRLT
jgi:hypothetical protein